MNPSLSDFIERAMMMLIIGGIILYQGHQQVRQRVPKAMLMLIAGICLLVLGHLPRMDSIVTYVGPRPVPDVRLDNRDMLAAWGRP